MYSYIWNFQALQHLTFKTLKVEYHITKCQHFLNNDKTTSLVIFEKIFLVFQILKLVVNIILNYPAGFHSMCYYLMCHFAYFEEKVNIFWLSPSDKLSVWQQPHTCHNLTLKQFCSFPLLLIILLKLIPSLNLAYQKTGVSVYAMWDTLIHQI